MANTKISALPSATTPLAGTEFVPLVQGGANVKVAVNNIGGVPGGSNGQVQYNNNGAFGGFALGTNVQTALGNTLNATGGVVSSGTLGAGVGFSVTPYNLGSASAWGSNAITLSASNGNMQYGVNDHAATITVQATSGNIQFDIANTTGAGAITWSGWDLVVGPTIDTTTTSKFSCLSKVNQTKVLYITKVA